MIHVVSMLIVNDVSFVLFVPPYGLRVNVPQILFGFCYLAKALIRPKMSFSFLENSTLLCLFHLDRT
jgi:hypothetical protein